MTTESQPEPAPAPPSFAAGRAMLVVQSVVALLSIVTVYPLLLVFAAMAGYTTARLHAFTLGFIVVAVLPAAVHALAAVNLGATRRGQVYVLLSLIVSAVQVVVVLVYAGRYGLCLMLPIALLATGTAVGSFGTERNAYVRDLGPARRRAAADLTVLAAAAALVASLVLVNDRVHDVDNRHPAREFDAGEASERLDSALDPLLAVLAEVEGMPDPLRDYSDADMCNDGTGWDEEWSDHQHFYRLEDRDEVVNISPNAGAGLRAIEAVRAHLTENGWDIAWDEQRHPGFHAMSAVRDDGVRVHFEVGAGATRLWAATGCIENA
ncbi:hypothetical protein [Glycomyces sp. NRRL B-16210]|uniref:hypothetical protein n=1 Tax=Glycomyces sp. NRRL B-16210 TaxID=1463821 RepID=UPI0004C11F38|nr:hypothetical protein [Glycomyces sp. NRRL B-16210]